MLQKIVMGRDIFIIIYNNILIILLQIEIKLHF